MRIDYPEEYVKEFFARVKTSPGYNKLDISGADEKILGSYIRNAISKSMLLFESGSKPEEVAEFLKNELKRGWNALGFAMNNNPENRGALYKKAYKRIKALGEDESLDWGDIFSSEINEDEYYLNEIFVRLVEEQEGVNITSAKQLQELTGITEIYPEDPENKKTKKTTLKEAQGIAYEQVEDTFIKAMYYRYYTTLEGMLEAGANYKDLLLLEPGSFNLPETWSGCLASDQYTTILCAIALSFEVDEPGSYSNPDLRAIAEEIGAPYSVLMDCYRLFNWINPELSREDEIIYKLKQAVRTYAKKQPQAWREEHCFNPKGKSWTIEDAQRAEENYINFYPTYFKILLYHELLPEEPLTDWDKRIIEYHKEHIYKHFKKYLDEAKEVYNKQKDKAKLFGLKQAINSYYLP